MTRRERKYHKKRQYFKMVMAEFHKAGFLKHLSFTPLPILEEMVDEFIKDIKQ